MEVVMVILWKSETVELGKVHTGNENNVKNKVADAANKINASQNMSKNVDIVNKMVSDNNNNVDAKKNKNELDRNLCYTPASVNSVSDEIVIFDEELVMEGCSGMKVSIRHLGPSMIQQMQHPCNKCKGIGETINDKDRCTQCKGEKVMQEKKGLEVHVEKGMQNGQKITFPGEVDEAHTPSLTEALCGFQLILTHLNNRELLVKSQPGEVVKPGNYLSFLISVSMLFVFVSVVCIVILV
ncbi:DnaJ protein [Tanacetum coccineum]|uniref:DnaJ protein n=1 Tax=Tanacetum coccineum TaxID=301880 RepID=A0ABQ5AYD6_9ASTR